jgi:glycosyltransferase involved in cell wall biosynthesis
MRKADDSCAHLITARPRFRHRIIFSNPDVLCEAIHYEGAHAIDRAYKIGYWAWELERPPASWVRAARLLDELWVPSEFVRKAFAGAVTIPVHTVPAPIRAPRPLRRYSRAELGLADDAVVFLFSFAYGSLAARKNPWAVVRAFRDAFPRHVGGVRLVLKSVQSELFEAEAAALRELAGDDPRIRFVDGFMGRDRLMGLQAACDCFVSLHRSEGFGLGLAECMALGKTVIATAYSGNLDFMNEDNSLLVDYRLVPVKPGEYPDTQGQVWAEASVEDAARKMRDAYADPQLRTRLGRKAAAHIDAHCSERSVGARLQAHLRRVTQAACRTFRAA